MIDLPTVVGMTAEERERHIGPQFRKTKGKEPAPAPTINWSRVFAWSVFILLLILCLRGAR